MNNKQNFTAYMAWAAICIVWGTTYLAIRIGVESLPPFLFAGLRWITAGPIFLAVLLFKKYKLPAKKDLLHIAIVGIALLGFGNGLVVLAEQTIPSGLTSLIITTTPFWMVGFESLVPKGVKINFLTAVGLFFGLLGIVLIFGGDLDSLFNSKHLLGVISLLGAVMFWAGGTVYSKYNKINVHPLMNASFQMIIAGAAQIILGLSLGEANNFSFSFESFSAFAYLVLFGSMIGYGSYIYAIEHLPISLVSTYAYVNPIIALFLGWLVLDEQITFSIVIASVVILVGVAIVKKSTSGLKFNLRGLFQK